MDFYRGTCATATVATSTTTSHLDLEDSDELTAVKLSLNCNLSGADELDDDATGPAEVCDVPIGYNSGNSPQSWPG